MALNCINVQKRVDLALKLGWSVGGDRIFVPPKHFECRHFAGIYKPVPLTQGTVYIPHFFADDYILTTGNWDPSDSHLDSEFFK